MKTTTTRKATNERTDRDPRRLVYALRTAAGDLERLEDPRGVMGRAMARVVGQMCDRFASAAEADASNAG